MTTDVLIKVDDLQKQFKGGKIKALDGVSTDIHKGGGSCLSSAPPARVSQPSSDASISLRCPPAER